MGLTTVVKRVPYHSKHCIGHHHQRQQQQQQQLQMFTGKLSCQGSPCERWCNQTSIVGDRKRLMLVVYIDSTMLCLLIAHFDNQNVMQYCVANVEMAQVGGKVVHACKSDRSFHTEIRCFPGVIPMATCTSRPQLSKTTYHWRRLSRSAAKMVGAMKPSAACAPLGSRCFGDRVVSLLLRGGLALEAVYILSILFVSGEAGAQSRKE
eukprot:3304644-Amphidinium_carterae.1